MFTVGAGEVAVFAVEHDSVPGVPLFDDLQATVDLATKVGVGEILRGEDRPYRTSEFFEGLVGQGASVRHA